MSISVKIPPLGESVVSGILAKWHIGDGARVKKDQPLFELETDKITSEGLAEAEGVITLAVPEGAEVKIGQVVATIEPSAAKPETGDRKPENAAAAPAAAQPKTENPKPETPPSPAVRRLAEETKIDPATVAGTGKAGRVTKGDMLAAAETTAAKPESGDRKPETTAAPTSAAPAPASAQSEIRNPRSAIASPSATARQTRRKMSPLRAKIAERLVEAKNQTAMLTTFNEVDMSAVRDLRARYQDDFTKRHGVKLGFMSLFVKAAVHALREVPAVNASLDGDTVVQNNFFDIGVAVSTERGLMVPVLRDCDDKSLAQIEKDLGAYATKAREGKIGLNDLQGGVFTITNGGIFGSLLSTPILNPPQCGILGMHAIQDRPVALNGQVVIRPMMYLALSYDHRLVDGKEAVTFLVKIKQAIEDPARLLLGV
ncbi:MAG TPA: 2-oxoglutarate dehydrogenase complex dihydrolipoyllysine-residue succinyltransferase [Opitutaceae bacterium]|nr:2-oxoglutarate dehydrogenase complex dihydrolipoyllysine-residue succinyltransferase [Opitutaceae bacterium]